MQCTMALRSHKIYFSPNITCTLVFFVVAICTAIRALLFSQPVLKREQVRGAVCEGGSEHKQEKKYRVVQSGCA